MFFFSRKFAYSVLNELCDRNFLFYTCKRWNIKVKIITSSHVNIARNRKFFPPFIGYLIETINLIFQQLFSYQMLQVTSSEQIFLAVLLKGLAGNINVNVCFNKTANVSVFKWFRRLQLYIFFWLHQILNSHISCPKI